ncbi:energy transducer TonB [Solitalea koreensis]|uniref:Protein TonB, links inner and outer membranes n=1 Tax=Solitalea koreensis TaxID=543615 RepID=A0A521D1R7_9SPHI|nr:energy transducer TonB [Solitalea koreensis]SMO65618.1 protein TonB, links inner and outer membranes [Solitalea koreensis]
MAIAQHKEEEDNSGKAFLFTTLLYVFLIALCFLFRITNPYTPEDSEGGIVVNYGTSDVGMGDDFTSVEEPSVDPNANGKQPKERVEETTPTKSNSSQNEKALITQDDPEAPELKTAVNKTVKVKTETPVTTPPKTETPKEQPHIADPNALYKGKKNTGVGTGDGTGTEPGNQGKTTGDPNSNSYSGTGTGGGGIALNLSGRKFISRPTIEDNGQTAGKVAVEIVVDRNGNISSAKAGARGTTISNVALWKKCEIAIMNCKLNAISTGPDTQVGMVVITFRLE